MIIIPLINDASLWLKKDDNFFLAPFANLLSFGCVFFVVEKHTFVNYSRFTWSHGNFVLHIFSFTMVKAIKLHFYLELLILRVVCDKQKCMQNEAKYLITMCLMQVLKN